MCLGVRACAPPRGPGKRRRAGPVRETRPGVTEGGRGGGGSPAGAGRRVGSAPGFPPRRLPPPPPPPGAVRRARLLPVPGGGRRPRHVAAPAAALLRGRSAELGGGDWSGTGGGGGPGRRRSLRRPLRAPAQLLGGEAEGPPFVHQLRFLVAPGPRFLPSSALPCSLLFLTGFTAGHRGVVSSPSTPSRAPEEKPPGFVGVGLYQPLGLRTSCVCPAPPRAAEPEPEAGG